MEEKDLKQYADIKRILDDLVSKNPELKEIKIAFDSTMKGNNQFASYQFPINLFDENMYNTIKEYAKVDYIITKQNLYEVGTNTKFNFLETRTNEKLAEYNYEHSLDFLESMTSDQYGI